MIRFPKNRKQTCFLFLFATLILDLVLASIRLVLFWCLMSQVEGLGAVSHLLSFDYLSVSPSQGGPLLWLASQSSFLELMISPVEADSLNVSFTSLCGSVQGLWVVQ